MKPVLVLSALLLGSCTANPAFASDKSELKCMTLEKAQKVAGKGTTIAPMNAAQFHFLQGVYVALPNTPAGLPPGAGALLMTHDGVEGGIIMFTIGKLVCNPIAVPKALMDYLGKVKAGAIADGEGA